MLKLFSILFITVSVPCITFGWDNNITHPKLTAESVNLLISQKPEYKYLEKHLCQEIKSRKGIKKLIFKILPDPKQVKYLDEGAVKEDCAVPPFNCGWDTSKWGSKVSHKVPRLSWKSHGFNPNTGLAWQWIGGVLNNTFEYSANVYSDILHSAKHKKYFHTGRFLHLIQDMTSKAHAHADFHGFGDDLETYAEINYANIDINPSIIRKPSTHGLSNLIIPVATTSYIRNRLTGIGADLQRDSYENFIRNAAWETYYMTSYYGGRLIFETENEQPDSELKRMFPYGEQPENPTGLRFIDNDFFNPGFLINDIGYFYAGFTFCNPEWWECSEDAGYFYIKNIDGDKTSHNGPGAVPAVFKSDHFRRVLPSDNLNNVLVDNYKDFRILLCESLFTRAIEWGAGFLEYLYVPKISKTNI